MNILVIGGSGYLGQFVVGDLADLHEVSFTQHSNKANYISKAQAHWADLRTGSGLSAVFACQSDVDVIINCAAISSPAACENDADLARQVNVPTSLLDAMHQLKQHTEREPLLIHLSTDQVYNGSKAFWKEDDPCQPVNTYGCTKLRAEQLIRERWPRHVILRSSIIYGLQSSTPVSRPLFLQMIVEVLQKKRPTTFFTDEFRSPVYVRDILSIIRAAIDQRHLVSGQTFNMGGPERLSRLEMANTVADILGLDKVGIILGIPSASVSRPVASPADISMDSSRLAALGVPLRTMHAALEDMRAQLLAS